MNFKFAPILALNAFLLLGLVNVHADTQNANQDPADLESGFNPYQAEGPYNQRDPKNIFYNPYNKKPTQPVKKSLDLPNDMAERYRRNNPTSAAGLGI